jgi:CRISPR-associated protein Cmr3
MNTILLQPTDVLFFRDGRPMGGASAGHAAAWPLPTVVNQAFHAALHRAGDVFKDAHPHRRGRSGVYSAERDRRFGSLVTAGPFPVCPKGDDHTWFFPRPADADDTGGVFLHPHRTDAPSSLGTPTKYPVVSCKPPSKETPKPWWSEAAWNAYVGSVRRNELSAIALFKEDGEFADIEHSYGIGINPESGTVQEGQFYSANYLRLREGWKLGVVAAAPDNDYRHAEHGNDLIRSLFNGHGTEIIVGGQQRVCTATLEHGATTRLPLPLGLTTGAEFTKCEGKLLVKWVLLSPAIWPPIPEGVSKHGTTRNSHPGGWLPNWICPASGDVLLEMVTREERRRRRSLNYDGKGYESKPARKARLVAALVPKPIVVTGWALANDTDRPEGGAKSTLLAVPAGAVYYFEAEPDPNDGPGNAIALANALNWHGSETNPTTIKSRRSTLMGEKGFGLGICGTWDYLENIAGRPVR